MSFGGSCFSMRDSVDFVDVGFDILAAEVGSYPYVIVLHRYHAAFMWTLHGNECIAWLWLVLCTAWRRLRLWRF